MLELRTRYYRAYPPKPSYRERVLKLMPRDTVLLHIDVQGGVAPPSKFEEDVSKIHGLSGYTFGWPSPEIAAKRSMDVVEHIEKVANAARDCGLCNVFVQHAHRADLSDAIGEWAEMHERTHDLKIGEVAQGME